MTERDIERYLIAQVAALGGETRKLRWVGRNGAPDRLVLLPDGRLLWCELKAPGGKCRPAQQREHARMARYGQTVHVLDSCECVARLLNTQAKPTREAGSA